MRGLGRGEGERYGRDGGRHDWTRSLGDRDFWIKERKHPGLQVPTEEQTKFRASAQSYSEDCHIQDHPTRQLLSALGPTSDLMGSGPRDGGDRADKKGGFRLPSTASP